MENGARLARLVPLLAIIAAVAALLIAPAALAQEPKSAVADWAQSQQRLGKREPLKELAREKRDMVQEKAREIREAVREKIVEKKGNVKEAAQEKRKEGIQGAMEALKEKRKTLEAKVASAGASKVKALDRARLKEIADLNPEQAKERLAELKVVKADENFKVRPIAEAAKEARKAAFEKLKEDEKTLRETYKERLGNLREVKERLRSCGNETQPGECAKAKADAVERAKEAALQAVDRIVTHLQKLKEKLQSSENMPEKEVAGKVARIDALISEVDAIKQKISAATTKEGVNAAVKELKDAVKKAKRASEAHSQGLLRAEINGVIHRAEVAEKKLDCALDSLGASSTGTSAVDAKLAEFSSKMGAAGEKLKQAKELLETDDEAKIGEGKTLIREASGMVREAHRLLEEIRMDIRKLGGQPCQEEQEIAVEQEEESEGEAAEQPPQPLLAPVPGSEANETEVTS